MLIDDYELARQIEQMKDVNRDDVIALIARQKPVDAVPVVRCENCKYFRFVNGMCEWHVKRYEVARNHFCAYGERRTENADDPD